jgi:hypothetical protein
MSAAAFPISVGSLLEASERAKRAIKPWLYKFEADGDTPAGPATTIEGGPIAVKLGVTIGAARRRDQLATARAHAISAYDHGLVDKAVYDAITEAATAREANLAHWRDWWAKIAPPRAFDRVQNSERSPRRCHRQRLALAGPLPPELGQHFTVGQCAVLKIIADEVWRRGTCSLSKKEIGDRAKACETLVHQTVRKAVAKGLLKIKLRPMLGRKSLPNLITIIDAEWRRWIYNPRYRAIREDREIEAEARHNALVKQGAQRRTPYAEYIYSKDEGVWKDLEVADQIIHPQPWLPPPLRWSP